MLRGGPRRRPLETRDALSQAQAVRAQRLPASVCKQRLDPWARRKQRWPAREQAVVATEVRSLAGRSADTAREIQGLINASVERVEQGTTRVGKAGATMTEVVAAVPRMHNSMGKISTASAEQRAGVAPVGQSVTPMDRFTPQNAARVEERAAAAALKRMAPGRHCRWLAGPLRAVHKRR